MSLHQGAVGWSAVGVCSIFLSYCFMNTHGHNFLQPLSNDRKPYLNQDYNMLFKIDKSSYEHGFAYMTLQGVVSCSA